MNFSASIFDMDGLLIDSEKIALRTFQEKCNEHALGDQFALYQSILGTNDQTTVSILSEVLPDSIDHELFMSEWLENYLHVTSSGVPLMKGVENLLDALANRGIPVAVATSTREDRAREKLHKSGILQRFDSVIGGNQIKNGKPAPDIYLKAALSLKIDPEKCVALEDSPNGVRAAHAAGMHVIQIPELVQPTAELLSLNHTVLTDLDEVITYLEL
jgi:HAD superfamily hydrolase (TIGR01509 family)